MFRNKTITPEMYAAGTEFRDDFAVAGLEQMRAAALDSVPGGLARQTVTNAQLDARNRVWEALVALGGHRSPAGCCAWFVIGLQYSLREWALREGWGGRLLHRRTASGILLGTLGVLQTHYGY